MQPCCSVALSGGSVDCLQRNHVHQLKENDSGDPGREQDPQPQADFFSGIIVVDQNNVSGKQNILSANASKVTNCYPANFHRLLLSLCFITFNRMVRGLLIVRAWHNCGSRSKY